MADSKGLTGRIVVCAPASLPGFFNDDCFGACALCGVLVRHRPYVPQHRSLICLLCFLKHAEPGDSCEITAESLEELDAIGFGIRH